MDYIYCIYHQSTESPYLYNVEKENNKDGYSYIIHFKKRERIVPMLCAWGQIHWWQMNAQGNGHAESQKSQKQQLCREDVYLSLKEKTRKTANFVSCSLRTGCLCVVGSDTLGCTSEPFIAVVIRNILKRNPSCLHTSRK